MLLLFGRVDYFENDASLQAVHFYGILDLTRSGRASKPAEKISQVLRHSPRKAKVPAEADTLCALCQLMGSSWIFDFILFLAMITGIFTQETVFEAQRIVFVIFRCLDRKGVQDVLYRHLVIDHIL